MPFDWYLVIFVCILYSTLIQKVWSTVERPKNNGDIYITSEETFLRTQAALIEKEYVTTMEPETYVKTTIDPNIIDFEELVALCNSSFSIPMDHYITFNTTADLPNVLDKTGMCFIRCFYEKAGIIENWKLNRARIQTNIWPATGDSLEVCENEGAEEKNPCVRAYAIAKCLTIRALVDARN
ncbi:odorant-binding protein 84a isoform X2 [Haematobia irritans]|uniref:odorant-binding protein 84a isoform X2 n=1 Tax=Haematobia irritans TaxID=7368 RepID=UPI003F504BE0